MADSPRPCLTDLDVAAFPELPLRQARSFHKKNLRRWVFARGARTSAEMSDLGKGLRAELDAAYRIRSASVLIRKDSKDGTTKLLFRLDDENTVESVLIPDGERTTLCVSTQVGCAVRCVFCASGMLGVTRNLRPGEIVEQFTEARRLLLEEGRSLTNLVLMGGGEPLNNFDAVKQALDSINHPDGCGFGARRITLSTIGIPSKIDRLEELGKQIHLAISLHAPNEALRGELIPGFDRIPLADVLAAAKRYFERTGREVTFEYVVLHEKNDRPEHARELASLLRGMRCTVNLIPFNPVDGMPYQRPAERAIAGIQATLQEVGIRTTVRRSRGRDIDAACGQLRRRHLSGEAERVTAG